VKLFVELLNERRPRKTFPSFCWPIEIQFTSVQTASALLELAEAMFCPNCKTEYRDGFSKCSDCGADLVPELSTRVMPNSDDSAELIWMGSNPQAIAAVKKLLAGAGIQFSEGNPESHMLFAKALPSTMIYVLSGDFLRARMLIDDRFSGLDEDLESTDSEDSDGVDLEEVPETDDDKSQAPINVPNTVPANWNPRMASCTIWRDDLLENVRANLLENGIGCHVASEGGSARLMIYPADESRAREIIREIIEGSQTA
jgi:hypothetical protein